MIKIAINGFGRIGRNTLRALYENGYQDRLKIIAINDLANPETNVHLTKYDSVHGKFQGDIHFESGVMHVNGDSISLFQQPDPTNLPWEELDIDVVLECSGFFRTREAALKHIQSGAKRVIISAPGTDVDETIVYGVNHHSLKTASQVISNASCTTNCLAPIAKLLHNAFGIQSGSMTTIHSYTNDQKLIDVAHNDIYRARSATQSMIPTKTGAASAVGLVIPELAGKLDGVAVRVPTINVSLVDFHCLCDKKTSIEEVNELIQDASNNSMKNIIEYVTEPLVSVDFNHNPASSCFDPSQTRVHGNMIKIMSWYDNEWGFSNRMLDTTLAIGKFC